MSNDLKTRIQDDVEAAMRARDRARLGALRLVTAAIKQKEVDGRIPLDDAAVLGVLEKMIKQRRDSLDQFVQAGRQELADQEAFEIEVIHRYMPSPLSETEVDAMIEAAVNETGAATMKDMGRLMGVLKPKLMGRADMGQVSERVKARLASA
ncbi:MAG TPA: GatB/YqeY domain-containing protein [Gammaproteobacteria bacterium]